MRPEVGGRGGGRRAGGSERQVLSESGVVAIEVDVPAHAVSAAPLLGEAAPEDSVDVDRPAAAEPSVPAHLACAFDADGRCRSRDRHRRDQQSETNSCLHAHRNLVREQGIPSSPTPRAVHKRLRSGRPAKSSLPNTRLHAADDQWHCSIENGALRFLMLDYACGMRRLTFTYRAVIAPDTIVGQKCAALDAPSCATAGNDVRSDYQRARCAYLRCVGWLTSLKAGSGDRSRH